MLRHGGSSTLPGDGVLPENGSTAHRGKTEQQNRKFRMVKRRNDAWVKRGMPHRLLAAVLAAGCALAAFPAHAVSDAPPGQNMQLPDNNLIEAARAGDVRGLHVAILGGLSPDDSGIDKVPAIIVATGYGHLDAVKYLLSRGAHPNYRARDGRTALSVAAQSGRADIAEALLAGGADPDQIADNRDTPLFIAVRARRTAIVQLLIRYNADLEMTDVTGRTALELADERHFTDIVNGLRQAGAE
jgi:hypothetical protein